MSCEEIWREIPNYIGGKHGAAMRASIEELHPVSQIQELLTWDLAASLQTSSTRLLRDTQQAPTQNKRTPDEQHAPSNEGSKNASPKITLSGISCLLDSLTRSRRRSVHSESNGRGAVGRRWTSHRTM